MLPAWALGTPQPGEVTPDCLPTQGVGGSPQQEEGPQAFLPTLGSHQGLWGAPRPGGGTPRQAPHLGLRGAVGFADVAGTPSAAALIAPGMPHWGLDTARFGLWWLLVRAAGT